MPKIKYKDFRFRPSSLDIIQMADSIIAEYASKGFDLTLRQLYYQFVARDLIPNSQKEYKNLGSVINDARLAGMLDWNSIIDRTRNLVKTPTWSSPRDIVEACALQYKEDLWDYEQNFRPEVWIEKDALIGVIENVCNDLRIPYFSCRGFTSQSEMWQAAQRIINTSDRGQTTFILHLGDHDPSGMDMSRDIEERLAMFGADDTTLHFKRIALNTDQVRKYNPPPNPAKSTDSRYREYRKLHGASSWELDALNPEVLEELIRSEVEQITDPDAWETAKGNEAVNRSKLETAAREM